MPPEEQDFRLPQNVRPLNYRLGLTPDLENFTFKGDVNISLEVLSGTSSIVMNAADLDIKIALVTQDHKIQNASQIVMNPEEETVSIDFDTPLEPGKATITLVFNGTLSDNLCGFYRSSYTLPDGTERHMATTQFEATDARRAFPCFDEPAQKATFDLMLYMPKDRTAISNMPVREEFPLDLNMKALQFETTPVMSTYLLAFMVGDLEHIEGATKNGTQFRVFATPGKKEQCRFALDVGIKALEYFQDYYGIPYPLPKMDMVAIPDFESGAMENWGIVTYREVALLFDPSHSSAASKQGIADIVSHELAHQWFGNLVTMEWWNDLWLNESFATFMGTKAVHHMFPEWNVWEQFYVEDTARGLSLDGLATSHPIEANIKDPKEIGQIFDAISYQKGASVLRMLENYLGEDDFRKGVAEYLYAHQYENAQTRDLWNALSRASGVDAPHMMDTWTKQTGYPVVEVARFHHEHQCGLEFRQERFFYVPQHSSDKSLWKVPLNISTRHKEDTAKVLLEEKKRRILIAASDRTPWIKVNSGQTGFFRVKYSPQMQKDLTFAIQQGEIPPIDRIGLASDAYALQRAGAIPATQYLDLARAFRDETEYTVWSEIAIGISGVGGLLTDEPDYEKFREFGKDIFAPLAQKMKWDPDPNEDELAPMLRSLALAHAGGYGNKEIIVEAKQRFEALCQDPESVDPNLRSIVCNLSARYGDRTVYDRLLELYRNAPNKEEQLTYLRAMGSFRDKELLSTTLEFAMSHEVRHENTLHGIIPVANNPVGRNLAWQFAKDNCLELKERYAHSMFMLGRIVSGVVSGFRTEEDKKDVEEFFGKHPVPEASMVLAQSLERIDMNIAWLARNRNEIAQWLQSN